MAPRPPRELGELTDSKSGEIIRSVDEAVGVQVRAAGIPDIAVGVDRLPYADRIGLLDLCQSALSDPEMSAHEETRVVCAKALVALVPLAAQSIKGWFEGPENERVAEIQFSLLCFLDQLHQVSGAADFVNEVPSLVEAFLMRVQYDPAHAVWMAGDLLGDHWELESSLPVLSRVATRAPHAVAREAALHGLGHALGAARGEQRWSVLGALRQVLAQDGSSAVRERARAILEGASA